MLRIPHNKSLGQEFEITLPNWMTNLGEGGAVVFFLIPLIGFVALLSLVSSDSDGEK